MKVDDAWKDDLLEQPVTTTMKRVPRDAHELIRSQSYWVECVLAGLLVRGVSHYDIEVRRDQDNPLKVAVAVRGVVTHEHEMKLVSQEA